MEVIFGSYNSVTRSGAVDEPFYGCQNQLIGDGGFNITVSHFSKMLTIPCTETCSIRPCHSKQAAEVLFIFKITSILIERAMCNEHDELPLTIVYNTCSGSEDDTCFVIILSFISFN